MDVCTKNAVAKGVHGFDSSDVQPLEAMRQAKEIIIRESQALQHLADRLPVEFPQAVAMINATEGAVIVSGVGKAGWIGQKISASMASLGIISHFVNPCEAFHGDLGRIAPRDVVLALSNSGETSELLQILPALQKSQVKIIAITAKPDSTLANHASIVLPYGDFNEACFLGLAPTTSTTAMLALGDALTLVVSRSRQFQPQDFAAFHPGGSLGKRLSAVDDVMRPLNDCRIATENETVREIYVRHQKNDRRVGVILVVDGLGRLSGLFTDSDLARLLERQQDDFFDSPISEVMTKRPVTVVTNTKTVMAVEILACRNLSELPVVDQDNRPIGLIDITDVVSLMPSNQIGGDLRHSA